MAQSEYLAGMLRVLILSELSRGESYGYGIARALGESSEDGLAVRPESLYPVLHRMEQDGWLRSDWATTEKNRQARYYELTAKGRKQLAAERESWTRLTDGVSRVLKFA